MKERSVGGYRVPCEEKEDIMKRKEKVTP